MTAQYRYEDPHLFKLLHLLGHGLNVLITNSNIGKRPRRPSVRSYHSSMTSRQTYLRDNMITVHVHVWDDDI